MFREIGDLTVLAAVADGKAEFIPTAAALVPFLEGRAAEAASSDFDEHRDEVQVRLVADLVVRSRAPPKTKQTSKWVIPNENFGGARERTTKPGIRQCDGGAIDGHSGFLHIITDADTDDSHRAVQLCVERNDKIHLKIIHSGHLHYWGVL